MSEQKETPRTELELAKRGCAGSTATFAEFARHLEREIKAMTEQRDELLAAARKALHEMTQTVAPRTSFTDAVDALDAAIAKVK